MSAERIHAVENRLYEMDHIPFEKTVDRIPAEERAGYVVPVRTSVGCNGFCSFCYRPFPSWHGIPAERVGELMDIYTGKGFRRFLFVDENMVGNGLPRFEAIMDKLITLKKAYPQLTFDFDARPDSFGDARRDNFAHGIVDKVRQAGVNHVFVGIEAGNEADLRYFRKFPRGFDMVAQNIWFLKQMAEHKVQVEPGFIMLNEESTPARVRQNIDFIDRHLAAEVVPEIYWYRTALYPNAALTRMKLREMAPQAEAEVVRKIVYGQYKVDFKDPVIQRFAGVLDMVRAGFMGGELDFDPDNENGIVSVHGQTLKAAHKKYFEGYLAMAESGDTSGAGEMVKSHVRTVKQIIHTSS